MEKQFRYYALDTILLFACKEGKKEVVEFCIKNGANINCIHGINLDSPLLVAARNGHTQIIDILVSNGVDLLSFNNKPALTSLNRLMELIDKATHPALISHLTSKFAELLNVDKYKLEKDFEKILNNKVSQAVEEEDDFDEDDIDDDDDDDDDIDDDDFDEEPYAKEKIFLSLRENPMVINVAIENKDIQTLQHLCGIFVTQYLPYYYEDLSKVTESANEFLVFWHSIMYSLNVHEYDLVLELVKLHHPNQVKYVPQLPYFLVSSLLSSKNLEEDHIKVIEILEVLGQRGQKVNYQMFMGKTALHLAAYAEEQQFVKVCKVLIKLGADWNIVDKYGATPLNGLMRLGVINPHTELLLMLMEDRKDSN